MVPFHLGWIRVGGIIIALLGFVITRLFVAEALAIETTISFIIVGIIPLIIGLALTIFGVILSVGAFSEEYVTSVMRGSLLGTGVMVAIILMTALDQLVRIGSFGALFESRILVANILLGGAVGGALIGHRSAENIRHQRSLNRQSNRALFVNRLLKHEVLNAATIIGGYAEILMMETNSNAVKTIQNSVGKIEETVTEIATIAEETERSSLREIDVMEPLHREIAQIDSQKQNKLELTVDADDTTAYTGPKLGYILKEILENAVEHGQPDSVAIRVFGDGAELCIAIGNEGPQIPDQQRALLESGKFPEFDDPSSGFGFQIVYLLVNQYGGRVSVANNPKPTITIRLPREPVDYGLSKSVGVTFSNVYRGVAAGIIAGVAMGTIFSLGTGLFPVIGALYGVEDPVVGWVTHLFHSIVFALIFITISARLSSFGIKVPISYSAMLGVAWGIILWFIAAGLIMPLWLRLLGYHSALPNLTLIGLIGHVVWGIVLAGSYHMMRTPS